MLNNQFQPLKVSKIASGWAAYGDGWAVHAATKELALKEYEERVKFYRELSKRQTQEKSNAEETIRRFGH